MTFVGINLSTKNIYWLKQQMSIEIQMKDEKLEHYTISTFETQVNQGT